MIKKIRQYMFSAEHSIEERRFVLASSIGCAAIVSAMVSVIGTQQSSMFFIALAICLAAMLAAVAFSARTRKYKVGGSVIILVSNLFLMPVGYFLGGGLESGAPIWLILGIVFAFVIFRGRLLVFYTLLSMVSFAVTFYMSTVHPEWVVDLKDGYSPSLDSYIAVVVVAILCGLLFQFQSRVLENELDKADEQKDQIETLNEMQSNFFASMSHEIRTPINTIIGLNEMTMREKQLPEEVRENTINIQNASKLLLSLINDILDMSKIQSGKMEINVSEYDTSRMLSEITNLHWNRAIEKGLHFDIQVGERIPPLLRGDETRIKQVIINILTNAIKYTEEGSVTMHFGGEFMGPDQFMLRVEIEDTGIGIRKENLPYLFDTFQRVDEKDNKNIEGTGLGLSIAKQLVDLMGGTISVNSIYTKGSTFRVEIPQEVAASGSATFHKPGLLTDDQPEYQQSFEAPEAKVLVVDDNDMNRIVCRKLLRATQVQVDLAESGFDCLEKVSQKHYDVILMDHEMPQMDGIQTLYKLRQQTESMCRDTPVIALTANAGSDREEFYLEHGFSAYLSKPIQSKQLEALLLACLPDELIERSYSDNQEETLQIFGTAHKLPFIVTTDSICDLPEELAKENEIRVMPYYIMTEHGRFRDMKEIDSDNLQNYHERTGKYAHSEPASVEDYEEFFGSALSEARIVLHLSSCRNVSNAYNVASKAAESFDNVYVLDTGQISSGLGLVAIRAVQLFRSGLRIEAVIDELEKYESRIQLNYLVPSLALSKTNYKSTLALRTFMNVFNLEPVFTTRRGNLSVKRFLTGYINSTLDQFIKMCLANKSSINTDRVLVTFAGCSKEVRQHVLEELEKGGIKNVIVNKASAVTYCNTGPSTVGITFEKLS